MNKESKIHWQCLSTCRVNDEVWFLNMGNHGLFCLNMQDFSIKYIGSKSFMDFNKVLLPYYADSCFSDGNKLLFFPNNCNRIMIYNIAKQEIHDIEIVSKNGTNIFTTAGIAAMGKRIWLFPHDLMQGIWILDLDTLQISQDKQLQDALAGINVIETIIRQDGMQIWVLSENKIYRINIGKREKVLLKQFATMHIYTIRFDGSSYWILQSDSTDVYKWNQEDQLLKYQLKNAEWIADEGIPYSNMIFLNNNIILLNYRLKHIMKIDQQRFVIDKAFEYPKNFRFIRNAFYDSWAAFYAFDMVGDKVLIYPVFGSMLLIYDINDGSVEGIEADILKEKIPLLEENTEHIMKRENKIYYEYEELCSLCNLLKIAKSMEINTKDETSFGKKIYMECIV